jgi:sterol desaturase/sphingolipid hydroxylase (fatty acid hydroxylase superfamily)
MNVTYAGIAIAAWFVLLLFVERKVPLRAWRDPSLRRLGVNVLVSALAIAAAVAVVRPAAAGVMQFAATSRVGLLSWLALPPALAFCAGVLLLDLSFYLWHRANHRVAFLWRFHVVHHIDPDLDVSTAFRFHFGEVALSAGFRVVQILLIGASPLTIAIYELVFQANTLFQHSNVRLPIRVERMLNRALVTPRMHGIHHSMVKRHDMSNFSVVFAWWDRLFGTLRLNVPQGGIVIGIPAYDAGVDNAAAALLLLPFHAQPDAWQYRDGRSAAADGEREDAPSTVLAA